MPAPKSKPSDPYARIYAVIQQIPHGRVATYGQVAALAGLAGHARQVGYALHASPEGLDLPWHRVINAKGEVSPRSEPGPDGFQRHLLEEEGIVFDARDRLDLERYRWDPDVQRNDKADKVTKSVSGPGATKKRHPGRTNRTRR